MADPIKKLRQKIRRDSHYVKKYLAAEDLLRKVGLPKDCEPITWGKRPSFIVLFFKRFFRMRDEIWSK